MTEENRGGLEEARTRGETQRRDWRKLRLASRKKQPKTRYSWTQVEKGGDGLDGGDIEDVRAWLEGRVNDEGQKESDHDEVGRLHGSLCVVNSWLATSSLGTRALVTTYTPRWDPQGQTRPCGGRG